MADIAKRGWKLTKNVRLSFKKNLLRMAQTTIVIAPRGVIKRASVNATAELSSQMSQSKSTMHTQNSPNATKLQISPRIIMIIPVHHSQFFKYACPSPATFPVFAVAASSPFFLTTKLVPIRTPEPRARDTPMILSVTFFFALSADAAAVAAAETADATALMVAVRVSVVDMVRFKVGVRPFGGLVSREGHKDGEFEPRIWCSDGDGQLRENIS